MEHSTFDSMDFTRCRFIFCITNTRSTRMIQVKMLSGTKLDLWRESRHTVIFSEYVNLITLQNTYTADNVQKTRENFK